MQPSPKGTATILIVDDEQDVRESIGELLELEGYEVVYAPDGAAALDLLRVHRPALIMLDLMMPKMDGFAFRAAQLADLDHAEIPVVIVSSMTDPPIAKLRPTAVMMKPVDIARLLALLARTVAQ